MLTSPFRPCRVKSEESDFDMANPIRRSRCVIFAFQERGAHFNPPLSSGHVSVLLPGHLSVSLAASIAPTTVRLIFPFRPLSGCRSSCFSAVSLESVSMQSFWPVHFGCLLPFRFDSVYPVVHVWCVWPSVSVQRCLFLCPSMSGLRQRLLLCVYFGPELC